MSIDYTLFLQFFVGLLAVINPFGLLPVFVSLTGHQSNEERHKTGTTASITVAVILCISLLVGESILALFSISIASFQIAGGLLILIIALSMLQGRLGEVKHTKEEDREFATKESVAVVPLAIPLMAGPGALSSVIVYGGANPGMVPKLGMLATILVFCLFCWATFRLAPVIFRLLGQTGINVITRIMGLLMIAIGVEFMAAGLKGMFPILA